MVYYCFEASVNNLRELENRQKENEMKQAIDEWRKRETDEFRKLVEDEQVRFEYNYIYFMNLLLLG